MGTTSRLGKTYKKETAEAVLALCRRPRKDVVILPTKKIMGMDREADPKKVVEYGTHRKRDKMQIGTSDQVDLIHCFGSGTKRSFPA